MTNQHKKLDYAQSPILVSVDELQKSVVDSKEVKVQTKEPPSTTQTIGLIFLPPPSPPKAIIDALQVPSAIAREAVGKLVQSIGTPPARQIGEEK